MPSDLTGLSSVDRVPLPPASGTAGTGATSSSRAITRIAPVDPRAPAANPTHPLLGRSGLDLLDLLSTTDLVAHREPTGSVAIEVGLEHARGSLLRNLPADALAALDSVWEGARKTEEGWYLRSGSLTVLGLPSESERVAEEGLVLRPTSLALRFMQSLSRMVLGDLTGARSVLHVALQRAPGDPLLLVQQALLQAKQGDVRLAEAQLSRIAVAPDHPALVWGRAALRTIVADATRQRSRPTPIDWPAAIPDLTGESVRATPIANDSIFPDITGKAISVRPSDPARKDEAGPIAPELAFAERASPDVAVAALERFGARVFMRPVEEVAREARMLMRAFSAGGTLVAATSAEQAHAVRIILTTFLGVATGEGAETPAPVRGMVEQLMPMLQQGRFDEADRLVRRQSALVREPIGRLLLAIGRGAFEADVARTAPPTDITRNGAVARESVTPAAGLLVVGGDSDRAPLVPVRLGLRLLDETPASRVAAHAAQTPTGLPSVARTDVRHVSFMASGSMPVVDGAERSGEGWGAAHSVPRPPMGNEWAEGAGVRAVALVCVALAAVALVTSHGAIAIGLAVGAVWLGLRRSGREGDGVRAHDRTPRQ